MRLPRLQQEQTLLPLYHAYLEALTSTEYQGDIATDYAARLAVATDNSIYQVIPQAVLFPRSTADVKAIMQLTQQSRFHEVTISPRGGGTGTNGQSLSAGLIIDCSRYLCHILEINTDQHWVRVEPGIVLDQLNAYLQSYGFYFVPHVSTSNRATLGGMINTDACGAGSKWYGRTSDHLISLTSVLVDGTIWQTEKRDAATIDRISKQQDRIGEIYRQVLDLLCEHQTLIAERFLPHPRTLNGYNLLSQLTHQLLIIHSL